MVKDIKFGESNGFDDYPSLTNVNGTLYFETDDGAHGHELWKSDGTEVGTVMVTDIEYGKRSAFPDGFTNINGTLYFSAYAELYGRELWKSDGTKAGTVMVKDTLLYDDRAYGASPYQLTNVNGTLYFTADYSEYFTDNDFEINFEYGYELWKSDGTEAGTVLVRDIRAGEDGSYPSNLTNVNGTLYFTADDGVHGKELWKSTEAGTVMVKDIHSGKSGTSLSDFTNINGTLYFRVDDGKQLWKSDGTKAGTIRIYSGTGIKIYGNLYGDIFFKDFDGDKNILLKSDGTQAGTVEIGRY